VTRNPVIAPFDEQFFLILNVAVGGTGGYFPGRLFSWMDLLDSF
jgi:hypothetical protein